MTPRFCFLLAALMAFTGSLATAQDSSRANKMRRWTDTQTKQSIRAKVIQADSGKVTLEDRNFNQIEIAFDRLSKSDRKFLKANFGEDVGIAKATSNGRIHGANGGQFNLGGLNGGNFQMPGAARLAQNEQGWRSVNWTPQGDLEQVLSANDDRPIFWFRVLGELDGNM